MQHAERMKEAVLLQVGDEYATDEERQEDDEKDMRIIPIKVELMAAQQAEQAEESQDRLRTDEPEQESSLGSDVLISEASTDAAREAEQD